MCPSNFWSPELITASSENKFEDINLEKCDV